MQNYYSSHQYACSSSQEIPRLLENLMADGKHKTLQIKMWTKYILYQYTNKAVCVLCCRILCTEEPSTHTYHEPNKKMQSCSHISFKHWLLRESL